MSGFLAGTARYGAAIMDMANLLGTILPDESGDGIAKGPHRASGPCGEPCRLVFRGQLVIAIYIGELPSPMMFCRARTTNCGEQAFPCTFPV